MLETAQLEALFAVWQLPPSGRAYIEHVRATDPARLVGSGNARNTPLRFASQRMGHVIQAESATVEGALVRICEYDQINVLEYWDQPTTVPLVITNRLGRRQRSTHTPDFLILRPSGPAVVECKPEASAELLATTRAQDWTKDGDDAFHYAPAEAYFGDLGISHEVWVPDDRSELRSSNIDLLLAVRRWPAAPKTEHWKARIRRHLGNVLIASIADLTRELNLPDSAVLLRGIHDGWLYAPLDRFLLSSPHDALVALSASCFDHAIEVIETWHRVVPNGGTCDVLPNVSQASLMLQRKRELDGACQATFSARTLRRHRQILRKSNGDVRALMPRARPGNKAPRITPAHELFIQECITDHHAIAASPSMYASYVDYKNFFDDKRNAGGLPQAEFPISFTTYVARVKARDPEHMALCRGGKRAANAAAQPTDRRHCSAPVRRPFESAQADHYLSDRTLVLRSSGNQQITRKPWISVLRDVASSQVLALTVGFRPPSRKVLSELLRDCARRHGRLPETIASDCGSDFQSTFYESTLAIYGVHKKDRPSGAPRFGGDLERLFGVLKTSILWKGAGSTRNDARGRAASPSHRSNALAEQDLIDFYDELESAIFDQLNMHLRGEALNSPDVILDCGLQTYPMSGIAAKLDLDFLVATSVDAPCRWYTIDPSRGINVLGRWYWSPALAKAAKSKVEVRLDSWDDEVVYARVNAAWVPCRSRGSLPSEARNLLAKLCRSTLRLDGRAELAQATQEADLSLARHLTRRRQSTSVETLVPADQRDRRGLDDNQEAPDNIPSISVTWSD